MEALAVIVRDKGYSKVNDVSRRLNVAPSSVTEMFRRLSEEGYINYEKYSGVTLTPKGEEVATKVQARHDTLTDFFILLGMEEKMAEEDACQVEHVVRPETMERLTSFVEYLKNPDRGACCMANFRHFFETGEVGDCKER